jgi:hypothetical protein
MEVMREIGSFSGLTLRLLVVRVLTVPLLPFQTPGSNHQDQSDTANRKGTAQ